MIAQTRALPRLLPPLRHTGRVARLPTLRSVHVSTRWNNTDPNLKREGPSASKLDPNKFDSDANSPGYYQAHETKAAARADPNPTAPPATRAAEPEAETPRGQSGSFSDHRGGGPRVDGEALTGSEEVKETRTLHRAGQILRNAAKSVTGNSNRSFSTSVRAAQPGGRDHPGYTTAQAPVSDQRQDLPDAPHGAVPSSSITNASTKAAPPHKDVHGMATGAQSEGSDAILPEDRSQHSWGSNARSAQFNDNEGKRNPIHHGGSNEGGFKSDGSSRT